MREDCHKQEAADACQTEQSQAAMRAVRSRGLTAAVREEVVSRSRSILAQAFSEGRLTIQVCRIALTTSGSLEVSTTWHQRSASAGITGATHASRGARGGGGGGGGALRR